MWRIEFTSAKFLPVLPEECQVNPGAYGFELAYWLSQALLKRNIIASYPECEDWGWFIGVCDADEDEFMIGCSSMSEQDEGYKGVPIAWSIFIKPYISIKDRFKGKSYSEKVTKLAVNITDALSEEKIEFRQCAA